MPEPTAEEKLLIAALDAALAARAEAERRADAAEERFAEADRRAGESEARLAEAIGSVSWRLTAPLRASKARLSRSAGPAVARAEDAHAAAPQDTHPDRPWRDEDRVPAETLAIEGMITPEEKRLLYWLARERFRGEGAIIDAGSYLGASTTALAAGLRDREWPQDDPPIVAYELFEINQPMLPFLPDDPRFELGGSFRPRFDDNVAGFEPWIEVIAGDITEHPWNRGPIEIAFIDVAKGWELNDFVTSAFFANLIPGRSIVVQQDYVGEHYPWIHITMARLASHFELLDMFEIGSAVYLLKESIPTEKLSVRTSELDPGEMLRLMDEALAPLEGERRGILECSRASLLGALAGPEAALAQLRYVRDRYAGSPRVLAAADSVASVAPMLPYALPAARTPDPGDLSSPRQGA
jgi:hypothetical protein